MAEESLREKIRRLRSDLAARGEDTGLAAPPIWRLAWRMGWAWKPPIFIGFWINALIMGASWGLSMLVIAWIGLPYISRPVNGATVAIILLGGGFFGLFMAGVIRSQTRRLQLPPWSEY